MSSGVKRWEMRDISGEAFSTLCESCYTEVRIELSRVVDNCGLYCEQEDSDRDLSMPLNICVFRQQFSYWSLAFQTCCWAWVEASGAFIS